MGNLVSAWTINEMLRSAAAHALAGRATEALALYEQALEADPNNAPALFGIGSLAVRFGQPERGAKHLRKAIERNRNVAEYHVHLSSALIALDQLDEAMVVVRRALKLKPRDAGALGNLGAILLKRGELDAAIAPLQRAIGIDPQLTIAHQNLGGVLLKQGRIDEALHCYRTSVICDPEDRGGYLGIVHCLNLLPSATAALIADATRRWARLIERPSHHPGHANAPLVGRKLRVGYVSADFRRHPVAFFLESVLRAHDRETIEVTCYSNNPRDDETTERLKPLADRWRPIRALDTAAAAALVRSDQIDVLVDLSGNTDGHRLPLFLVRPAPIQCTWLGYYATTGLPEIDYIIADDIVLPRGEEALYAEKPWRLPDSYLCFTPPDLDLAVGALPALRDGAVTFGCCNNVLKVNKQVVAVWSRLLQAMPSSRLLLRSMALSFPQVCAELTRQFVANDIAAERLILLPLAERAVLLATYNEIDIALDPFPYGGGTTTAEALWMGVPVVSIHGDRFTGRVSASMLTTVGLPELVVADEEHYIAKAIELATDLPQLAALRAGLRDRLVSSPLCAAPRFARHLETAYRAMWQTWSARKEQAA
jgi:protein O-GlcNAc transferase